MSQTFTSPLNLYEYHGQFAKTTSKILNDAEGLTNFVGSYAINFGYHFILINSVLQLNKPNQAKQKHQLNKQINYTNMMKTMILSALAAATPLVVQADMTEFFRIVGGNDAEKGDYPYYGKNFPCSLILM